MKNGLFFLIIFINLNSLCAQSKDESKKVNEFICAVNKFVNIEFDKIKKFIQEGVNINAKNDLGNFALNASLSSLNRHNGPLKARIANILLDAGASVNLETQNGNNALSSFMSGDYVDNDLLQRLLNLGINVNKVNKKGETPLSYAFFNSINGGKPVETIKLLLLYGADYKKISKLGYKPHLHESVARFQRAKQEIIQEYAEKLSQYDNKVKKEFAQFSLPELSNVVSQYAIQNYQGEQILEHIIEIRKLLGELAENWPNVQGQQQHAHQQNIAPAQQAAAAAN